MSEAVILLRVIGKPKAALFYQTFRARDWDTIAKHAIPISSTVLETPCNGNCFCDTINTVDESRLGEVVAKLAGQIDECREQVNTSVELVMEDGHVGHAERAALTNKVESLTSSIRTIEQRLACLEREEPSQDSNVPVLRRLLVFFWFSSRNKRLAGFGN